MGDELSRIVFFDLIVFVSFSFFLWGMGGGGGVGGGGLGEGSGWVWERGRGGGGGMIALNNLQWVFMVCWPEILGAPHTLARVETTDRVLAN